MRIGKWPQPDRRCQCECKAYTDKDQSGGGERKKKWEKWLLVKVKISLSTTFALTAFFHFVRLTKKENTKNMKNVLLQTSPTKSKSHTIAVSVSQKFARQQGKPYLPSFATNLIWKQHSSKWNRKIPNSSWRDENQIEMWTERTESRKNW